jgi:hypothetical protein
MSIPVSTLTGSNTINQMMYNVNTIKNLAANSAGSVANPGSSTDNAVMRFDGTSGGLAQDSSVLIADDGTLTTTGGVGIGTSSPAQFVHISKATVGNTSSLLVSNPDGTGGASAALKLGVSPENNSVAKFAIIHERFAAYGGGDTYFCSNYDADATEVTDADAVVTIKGSTGNIGIGTTAPDGNLNVHRTAASAGWIINGQTAGIANDSGLYMDSSNNIEMAVRNGSGTLTAAVKSSGSTFFNGGNVGIGTTSPSGKLSIQADATSDVDLRIFSDTANTPRIYLGDTASQTQGAIGYYNSADALFFQSNGSERMRIDSSGNVGIGTTSPDELLDIEGGNVKIGVTGSNAGRLLVDTTTDTVMRLSVNRGGSTGQLAIHTGADTETMRIDSSGNVGIGTTSPDGKLHVFSASAGSVTAPGDGDELVVEGNFNTGISILSPDLNNTGVYFGSASDNLGAQILWNRTTNRLLIGTDNAGAEIHFHVGANARVATLDASGNLGIGRIPTTNKLEVAGTIESTSGGFKFPDATTQTSAGASTGKVIAMAIVFG